MFRPFATLLLTLILGTALAIEFPASAQLTFISSDGTVVAAGDMDEGDLSLDVLADFSGFVTIAGVDQEGNVVTFEATVEADGTITVLDMDSFEFVDLEQSVAAAGGQVDISYEETIEAQGNTGLEQAWEVADENGHQGLEQAEDAQTVDEDEVDTDTRETVDRDDTDENRDRNAGQDDGQDAGKDAGEDAAEGARR